MSGVNRGAPHPLLRPAQSGGEGHLAERGYPAARRGCPRTGRRLESSLPRERGGQPTTASALWQRDPRKARP